MIHADARRAAVDHENTGPRADMVGIARKKSVESRVTVAVDELFGLDSHGVLTVMNLLVSG